MKIVYLHQYFNTPEMSGGTRSYEFGRRLVAEGHEVHMVTTMQEPVGQRGWFETHEAGMNVHWLPLPYSNRMGVLARIRAFLIFALRAAIRAARLEGDVVFVTSTPLTIAIPGLVASWLRRRPMVFEVRDLWPTVPIALGVLRNPFVIFLARMLERVAYANSSRVVALAPGMARHVAQRGVPQERIVTIPNGCDLDAFRCTPLEGLERLVPRYPWLEKDSSVPLVAYMGTIGGVNDVEFVVLLAAAMRDQGSPVKFVVIGDGKARDEVEALAHRLDVHDTFVKFVGRVQKSEIPAWLSRSVATLMTYAGPEIVYRDSVSNKFFDSIAAGRPVFANFEGFSTRIAVEADAGVILDRNPIAAARTLHAHLSDRSWLSEASTNARALAEERFSRDDQARQLRNTLQEAILGGRAGKRREAFLGGHDDSR